MLKMPNVKIFQTIVFWIRRYGVHQENQVEIMYIVIVTIDYCIKLDDQVYFTMELILKYCSSCCCCFILVRTRHQMTQGTESCRLFLLISSPFYSEFSFTILTILALVLLLHNVGCYWISDSRVIFNSY